ACARFVYSDDLVVDGSTVAALQDRIAAERDDDAHQEMMGPSTSASVGEPSSSSSYVTRTAGFFSSARRLRSTGVAITTTSAGVRLIVSARSATCSSEYPIAGSNAPTPGYFL